MKAPFVVAVALVAVTFAGVAQAGPGPTSKLYLTAATVGNSNGWCGEIAVVKGNSVANCFAAAYGGWGEAPIAVYGDVRTTGNSSQYAVGGQYTLGGTPTGTTYLLPSTISDGIDSTSDGFHNYLVDFSTETVYQTARDFSNPIALFTTTQQPFGITYDATNHSLWISTSSEVRDYSLNGALLSSFAYAQNRWSGSPLALDPADQTLWLQDIGTYDLVQYSKAGALLSTGPYVGWLGGGAEFDLQPTTPEPGTLILFGSGILGLAGMLRRKINL